MVDVFGPLLLLLFCSLVSYWEYSRLNTIITPFGVLAWPYTVIVMMINFGGKHFGYFPVSLQSIFFVMGCFGFFIISGRLMTFCVVNGDKDSLLLKKRHGNIEELFKYYRPLFVFLAIVSIVAGVIHFHRTINEIGLINIASIDFDETYGSGPLSHIMILSRPAFIFLFAEQDF